MFFSIGIVHTKKETNVGTLLRSAHCFGAAFVFTVGRRYQYQPGDTTQSTRTIPCFHFTTLDDLSAHLPIGCRLVGIELVSGATDLPLYQHPKQACYLLGAEDHGLTQEARAQCHDLVVIPNATYCLNVAVAGSLVMYDRSCKMAKRRAAEDLAK